MKRLSLGITWLLASICLLVVCLTPLALGIPSVLAEDSLGVNYMNETGLSAQDPRVTVARIIQIALGFLGTIAVVLIIYAGFLWMTSEGNADKLKKAKDTLKSAAIGLLIILSAFAIVTFVIDKLNDALGNGSGQSIVDRDPDNQVGLGALGSGIIQSVYPAPGQTDVPRNTGVIVTFREKVKASTVCQGGNDSTGVCNNANIVTTSIKFFQTEAGDNETTNLAADKVKVSSSDGKTFVFAPTEYLGSASTNIWQSVKLTTAIRKANGQSAFNLGDFVWQFEVSTRVDLTPPQVQIGGITPFPDDGRDINQGVQLAQPAMAILVVSSTPQTAAVAVASSPEPRGSSGAARLEGTYNCSGSGTINITASGTSPVQAQVTSDSSIAGLMDDNDVSDGRVSLGCGLTLIKNGTIAPDNHGAIVAGNGWDIEVSAARSSDSLTVGNQVYNFVSASSSNPNHIVVASSLSATVDRIIERINQTNSDVSASLHPTASNKIVLQARFAGEGGNSLILLDNSLGISIETGFSGGQNRQEQITVNGLNDSPRNSIIQINFSEPVNPLTLVGTSQEVSSTIEVLKVSNGTTTTVAGKFVIANQYQTLEFIPSEECGTNACGDLIYCLPANSQLLIKIRAANLQPCAASADCLDKTPYNQCIGGSCQKAADDYYPLAALPLISGLVDASFNSLDGNRDTKTVGPNNFYSENTKDINQRDSYSWSFWVNDDIDLTPPRLQSESLSPSLGLATSSLNQLIEFSFNKLMMISTLNSGEVLINNHNHRLINLFSTGLAPGYWLTSQAVDFGVPDGYPDFTRITVNHDLFADATRYSVEIGSGVKDSRQNCFKPCQDNAACGSTDASCCNGAPSSTATCN
jgi:hypothetical protein